MPFVVGVCLVSIVDCCLLCVVGFVDCYVLLDVCGLLCDVL